MFRGLDHETLCEKLKETVEMIKELHQSNKVYRENVQSLSEQHTGQKNENFHLQNENRDLRDRIEMYENIIGAQTYDVNQEAWRELLTPTKATENSTTASEVTGRSVAPMLLGANN